MLSFNLIIVASRRETQLTCEIFQKLRCSCEYSVPLSMLSSIGFYDRNYVYFWVKRLPVRSCRNYNIAVNIQYLWQLVLAFQFYDFNYVHLSEKQLILHTEICRNDTFFLWIVSVSDNVFGDLIFPNPLLWDVFSAECQCLSLVTQTLN